MRNHAETGIIDVESLLLGDAHVVRVHLRNGTTGIGQSAFWGYPAACHALIDAFRPALIGQDALRREHLWQVLYRMGPFRGAALSAAVAAVDLALWDAAGKLLGVPVWQLLGGRVRDRVRLHLLIESTEPDGILDECRAAAEAGSVAVKFDPIPVGYQDMTVVELAGRTRDTVAAVRDALPSTDLVLEMHRKLTPGQAVAVGRNLAGYDLAYWEDPVQIDTFAAQVDAGRSAGIPLGLGERFHTVWEFGELLTGGGVQYIRPDVGLAGGLTHARKIAAVGEASHCAVSPHNCLGPILTMATVHLAASISNFSSTDYTYLDERLERFVTGAAVRDGGYLVVPDEPGLGVELVDDPQPQTLVGRRTHEIPMREDGSVAFSV